MSVCVCVVGGHYLSLKSCLLGGTSAEKFKDRFHRSAGIYIDKFDAHERETVIPNIHLVDVYGKMS